MRSRNQLKFTTKPCLIGEIIKHKLKLWRPEESKKKKKSPTCNIFFEIENNCISKYYQP